MITFPHDVRGWLTEEEGQYLAELAQGKRVLEVGSYCGRSTICLAQTARDVVTVDPHTGFGTPEPCDTWMEFCGNITRYGVKCYPIRSEIQQARIATGTRGKFGLIFIDGVHLYEYVKSDIETTRPLLETGGIFAFHDVRQNYHGVLDAIGECIMARGGKQLGLVGSVGVFQP